MTLPGGLPPRNLVMRLLRLCVLIGCSLFVTVQAYNENLNINIFCLFDIMTLPKYCPPSMNVTPISGTLSKCYLSSSPHILHIIDVKHV